MNNSAKIILGGIAIGLFASWVKSKAEPPLQDIGERYFPPTKDELELKGADVNHHPENMPPAVLAKNVYRKVTNHSLSSKKTIQSMEVIHYTLGAFVGMVYVAALVKQKKSFPMQGILAGTVVWAATHGSVVPAIGLQAPVKDMPKSWWVWEFGSHIVFGIALEKGRQILNKLIK